MTAAAPGAGATVLDASGLSKKYCRELRRSQWYGLRDIARELLGRGAGDAGLRRGEFWALRDVSFRLGRGESLAVVGGNGAGKSTLLKVLYGLVKPDGGRVGVAGRVAALIELGTGFNPVLSGRENVYLNAAVLGLPRRRVDLLIDEIADFAGVGEFLDAPVQYYSSGMQARLSYAVAAHLAPDVLLVDEVLAVGDVAYQRKCIAHMQRYLDAGGALVLVSHNPYQIQSICQRGILLEGGRLTHAGTAVETLGRYMETRSLDAGGAAPGSAPVLDAAHPVGIEGVAVGAADGGELRTGGELVLALRYRSLRPLPAVWGFNVWTGDQWVCVTGDYDMTPRTLAEGAGELRCTVPRLPLLAGSYLLRAAILDPATLLPLATSGWNDPPHPFTVRSPPSELGNALRSVNQLMTVDVEWS